MISFKRYMVFIALICLSACSSTRVLAPTPNIFADGTYPEAEVAPALQTTRSSLFYVTDRQPVQDDGALTYGSERSSSAVFGVSEIAFGEDTDWQSLATASGEPERAENLALNVIENREILRFDPTPIPFRVSNLSLIHI